MSQPLKTPQEGQVQSGQVQGKAGDVILFDLHTLAQFRDDGPQVQILSDIGTARLVLFAFKAGQQLKEHHTSSQLFVQVIRGQVTFGTPGSSATLQEGMVLQLEASVSHSVLADSDAVVLLTMTPSPVQHSLEREVFQKLTPIVSRTPSTNA